MNQTSFTQTQQSVQLETLIKGALEALVIQIIGITLNYLIPVFLARWMGKTEYGMYEYVISWSLLLAIPAGLGLPRAVLRFISQYRVKQDWGHLRGLLLGSWQLTVVMSILICLAGTGIIFLIEHYHHFAYSEVLIVGLWLVPLQALVKLQEDIARGADSIALAYAPSKILWPLLIMAGGFFFFEQKHTLASISMTRVAILTLFAVVFVQLRLLWTKFDQEIVPTQPVYAPREWLGVALPLLLHRSLQNLLKQTDILTIGLFLGTGAVGIYSAAAKTAIWVSFVLQTVNLVCAPTFAILHTQDDRQSLQTIVSTVTLWIFFPSALISLCLIVFAKPILGIFGTEFVVAHWELKILVVGQLVSSLCGSVGNLVTMTGHQNKALIVSICCALINLVLNFIAIPTFGTIGAAMATTFTIIVRNFWLSILVIRNIGINPSIFGVLPRLPNLARK